MNPYYVYSGAFIPGQLARAEALALEFNSVSAGFSLLAIQGVDTGAADAYVVTTQGAPTGAYVDGDIVEFKAANSNTGVNSPTINVNSVGVVGLVQANGQTLAGGAIIAGTWYRAIYNSTFSAFTVVAPVSAVITSNTISASPPTNKVGLIAAGGVSLACAPIDVTFALDQSIAPTWTGVHIFSAAVTFASTVNFAGGLTLTGLASQYAITLDGNSTPGSSFGLHVAAGLNASDICALFQSQSGTAYLQVLGEGSIVAGTPTGGAKGIGTINATGLYVNGTSVITQAAQGSNPTAVVGLSVVNGTATTYLRSDGAPPLDQSIAPTWTGTHIFNPGTGIGTAITINLQPNSEGITINGGTNTAGHFLMRLFSAQAAGFSNGLVVEAGTNESDTPFEVATAAGSVLMKIFGNGENVVAEPTTNASASSTLHQVGYVDAPQLILNASGTFSQSYRGKSITHFSSSAHTWTLPTDANVNLPLGASFLLCVALGTITLNSAANIVWATGTGVTGSRTLTAPALVLVHKYNTGTYMLSGAGIS